MTNVELLGLPQVADGSVKRKIDLRIRSTLTDNDNVYSQLQSPFFCFLQELMQNSQCVQSKWKNKYVGQVKRLDMLSQCLTSGAESYAVIGILVL